MGLSKPQFIRDSAGAALHEGQLASRVDALPLLLIASRAVLVVDGGVDQQGRDAVGKRRGGVVLGADDLDVLALGARDRDEARLVVRVVERLDVRVVVVAEPRLGALENKVEGRLVAGLAKGAVAAVAVGDVVEVPQDVLEPGETGLVWLARILEFAPEVSTYSRVVISASSLSGVRRLPVALTAGDSSRAATAALVRGVFMVAGAGVPVRVPRSKRLSQGSWRCYWTYATRALPTPFDFLRRLLSALSSNTLRMPTSAGSSRRQTELS